MPAFFQAKTTWELKYCKNESMIFLPYYREKEKGFAQ